MADIDIPRDKPSDPAAWERKVASIKSMAFARSLCGFSSLVDVPHPDEPGVRVVGFKYLEAQAEMCEALRAMMVVQGAASERLSEG